MLRGDVRGFRVVLVADAVANDPVPIPAGAAGAAAGQADLDVMGALVAADYGAVIPPPHDFALATIGTTIEHVVDDLLDYAGNGYRVVLIGSGALPGMGYWGDLVDAELTARHAELPDRFDVDGRTPAELVAFLTG